MTSSLAILLFLAQDQEPVAKPSAVIQALRYLAKHQHPNGSWGTAPSACTCRRTEKNRPAGAPPDQALHDRIQASIDLLREGDPEVRLNGFRELEAIGVPALGGLRTARHDSDSEVRLRTLEIARRIESTATEGNLRATAAVVLAFLWAGYSELSKDEFDRICFGDVVRNGIKWLIRAQSEEGAFSEKDAVANSLAALAITECYGMTCRRKVQAERAVAYVERQSFQTARVQVWQGMVLLSAQMAEIGGDRSARFLELSERIARQPERLAFYGRPLLSKWAKRGTDEDIKKSFFNLQPLDLTAEELYIATLAFYHLDQSGETWHRWFDQLRQRLAALQGRGGPACEEGSWGGEELGDRVEDTAFRALTLEHYRCWYCRCVFRNPKDQK